MHKIHAAVLTVLFVLGGWIGSVDAGVNHWSRLPLSGGYVLEMSFSPADPSVVYARLSAGVVARSTDAGKTWTEATRTLYEDGGSLKQI